MSDAMSFGLVIEAAWKSVLVSGLALLVLALLKRRSAAERACVAHFGMAAVLMVPVLVLAGPDLEVSFLDAQAAGSPGWLGDAAGLVLYLVPAAVLLAVTCVAIFRLVALRGRANVIVQQGWLTALAHAQRRMGIKHGTALLVTQELRSPVSWGVLRPVIVLNEEALESAEDAEAIIAHELAHVARFDWLNLLIARIATALFWFNPLVWLLARQGHQLREESADDAVLCADVPNTDYAALLVGAARHEGRGLMLAANGVAPGKGSLALRVRRILEPTLRRSPARLSWGGSCAAGAVLIAGPLAALAPAQPSAPEPPIAIAAAIPMPARIAPPAPTPAQASVPRAAPSIRVAAPLAPPAPPAARPAAAIAPAARRAAAPAAVVPAAPPAPGVHQPPPAPIAPPAPLVRATASATSLPGSLIALRENIVEPSRQEEYAAAYPRLRKATAEQLMTLRAHAVSPRRLRDYAALGYGDLDCSRLVEWAVHGVSPSYIKGLAGQGYAGLAPAQLTRLRVMGVTAGYIRRLRAAGIGTVSPERLVELRIHGGGRVTSTPPMPPPRGAPYG